MNLIYEVVVSRSNECDHTLLLTVDRMVAINKARDYNGHRDWDRAHVAAWVDGEYNAAYVDLETAELFNYADHGGRYEVTGDFSFAANPPEHRKDDGPDEWID